MNIDSSRRETARLVGLAEAVAERAVGNEQHDLARFARCAAQRFQACVLSADPQALAVARYEAERLLRDGLPTREVAVPTRSPGADADGG